jgi:Domain of unknown function (DUF4276)
MLSTVYLAAEDVPGLAVGHRLVAEQSALSVYRDKNGHGFGNLKKKAPSYDQMGKNGFPVLMLTDLDTAPCPSGKIHDWLGRKPNRGFLFRICVREVEAWLLADIKAMGAFLKIKEENIPTAPESLPDPKAMLIKLAQKAPRKIRVGLTPQGSAPIGPEYNDLLSGFIADSWSIDRAVTRAPSLQRARKRVGELAALVASEASP